MKATGAQRLLQPDLACVGNRASPVTATIFAYIGESTDAAHGGSNRQGRKWLQAETGQ
ncbi:hypothetical protein [Aurantiacibacter zhengii]|uniref:hypothetical protein n=1 Tax=Aurantiacibacter zhengii TaxID=2307003 RepID=UPI0013142161|nr:hypothetical protein [Aurantiacibacter zhengii]